MIRRSKAVEKAPIRARDLMISLSNAHQAVVKLKGQGKVYEPLLDVILAIGEDDRIPMNKELQARFAITPSTFKKWIDSLAEDFLTAVFSDSSMLNFPKLEHRIFVKGYRDSASFVCQLPVTPRVGESVYIPFISAFVNGFGKTYYVYAVNYELVNSTMIVNVRARQDTYNKHVEYLKDRSYFEERTNTLKQWDMTESEIEEQLRDWYKNG